LAAVRAFQRVRFATPGVQDADEFLFEYGVLEFRTGPRAFLLV
jgi:hypothetical protein